MSQFLKVQDSDPECHIHERLFDRKANIKLHIVGLHRCVLFVILPRPDTKLTVYTICFVYDNLSCMWYVLCKACGDIQLVFLFRSKVTGVTVDNSEFKLNLTKLWVTKVLRSAIRTATKLLLVLKFEKSPILSLPLRLFKQKDDSENECLNLPVVSSSYSRVVYFSRTVFLRTPLKLTICNSYLACRMLFLLL